MSAEVGNSIDFIEELRLRRWARENYVSPADRNTGWHPIILDEMGRKDIELHQRDANPTYSVPQA